jgi:hypothetical protein
MNKKIIFSSIVVAIMAVVPLSAMGDNASSTKATTTDFSNFVGLQVPSGLQMGSDPVDPVYGPGPFVSAYPNGPRLIKVEGGSVIYWVAENNLKIPMFTRSVFLSYHNKDADVQTVSQDEFNYYVNAKYIQLNGKGLVYFVSGKNKQSIPASIWNQSGVDAGQVISVNKTDFNSYKTGKSVKSTTELN